MKPSDEGSGPSADVCLQWADSISRNGGQIPVEGVEFVKSLAAALRAAVKKNEEAVERAIDRLEDAVEHLEDGHEATAIAILKRAIEALRGHADEGAKTCDYCRYPAGTHGKKCPADEGAKK